MPFRPSARVVLAAGLAYLALAWLVVGLVDVFDVAGLRARLGRDDGAPLWIHLFGEGAITEILQWIALGVLAITATWHAARLDLDPTSRTEGRFVLWLGISAVLMLFEDAGSPSQRLADYAMDVFGDDSYLAELLFRMPLFVIVGGVPLYAFARYWRPVARRRPGGGWLLTGFGLYGLAALSSNPANIAFDFYLRAGPWLLHDVFGGRMVALERTDAWQQRFTQDEFTGTLFMDYAYEESLEMLAVVFLLAGTLALARHLRRERVAGPPPA